MLLALVVDLAALKDDNMFDIYTYLNEVGINYWTEGRNISQGWTGVKCVWCNDRSNHLGISPNGYTLKCWKCGKKANIVEYIKTVENCNFNTAKSICKKFSSDYLPEAEEEERVHKVEFPLGIKDEFEKIHRVYLRKRKYNPRLLKETFHLMAGGVVGPFKYRIIAPVYEENKLVTFLGRDITNKAALKYKNLSNSKSIVAAKHCVYNLDNTDGTAIITEGITDVWRLGSYGVVATLGLVFTTAQVNRLAAKLNRCYIMFDSEPQAIKQAEELGNLLSMAGVDTVEVLELSEGDPADLTQNEVLDLRKSIFGKAPK